MDKSKKIIIVLGAILVVILVFIAVLVLKEKKQEIVETPNTEEVSSVTEFMTTEEKETLMLEVTPETKIQVISRDENGKINAYKIIKNE